MRCLWTFCVESIFIRKRILLSSQCRRSPSQRAPPPHTYTLLLLERWWHLYRLCKARYWAEPKNPAIIKARKRILCESEWRIKVDDKTTVYRPEIIHTLAHLHRNNYKISISIVNVCACSLLRRYSNSNTN